MVMFALVHGAGDGGWAWHLVQAALRDQGHDAVAPDLPTDREDVTWEDCALAVADAVGAAAQVVVVGHSAGGFVVPLAAERLGAALQVHVAGMVPRPGERASEWFEHVGWQAVGDGDPSVDFYEDVPTELAREAMKRQRATSEALAATPWPGSSPSALPARYVVTTRDRFISPDVQRRVAAERLGIDVPDEIDAGHCVGLSSPTALADLLAGFV